MATATIPKRSFGNTGEQLSIMGLGCLGMSGVYADPKDIDEEECLETIRCALESGINFFDTADVYGQGHNERLLAKAIKRFGRDKFFIATKFGLTSRTVTMTVDNSPEYIRQACDDSLQRLGIDCIDLYYCHRIQKEVPIEQTVGVMADLVKEGKVRHLGLCEVSADTLRKAHAVHPIAAVQSEFSLWTLDIQDKVMPTCRDLGIAIVAYSPLGRGFLTGQIKSPDDFGPEDWRRTIPRFMGENFQKNLDIVRKLEEIAKEKGCTTSQLALAWVLAQGDDIFPIPGTKRVKHLKDNIGAVNVKLSDSEMDKIQELLKTLPTSGDRYNESGMSVVNV